MSRVQVHKVRKRLQKKKGQKNCPKKPKKPCKTRLFGIGCIFLTYEDGAHTSAAYRLVELICFANLAFRDSEPSRAPIFIEI